MDIPASFRWRIQVSVKSTHDKEELKKLHEQLSCVVEGIREITGRELFVLDYDEQRNVLLVMDMEEDRPNIPATIYSFNVRDCTCVNVRIPKIGIHPWKDVMNDVMKACLERMKQEVSSSKQRPKALEEVLYALKLETTDENGGVIEEMSIPDPTRFYKR